MTTVLIDHADARGPVTIDLGVAGEIDARNPLDDAAPGLPRGWGLALSLAVLALLTAGAPLPPPPHQIARIPLAGSTFALSAGGVYVVDAVRLPSVVTAFDPQDGHQLWRYVSQSTLPFGVVQRVDETVLLAPDPCISGATGSTSVVDAKTGQELWHRVGVPLNTPADLPVAVITQASWSDRCGAMTGDGHALTGSLRWDGVDRATGAVRWQTTLVAGTFVALDGGPAGARWVALLEPDNRVSVLDLATGERSPPRAGLADQEARWFTASHGLVLVSRVALDPPVRVALSAYDRTTAARVWTAEVPMPDRSAADRLDTVSVRTCGPYVCVVADDTAALDPATGEVRWHTKRAAFTTVPGGLLADYTLEPSLISGAPRVILHDPATGRVTAKFDSWRLLGIDARRQRLLIGEANGDSTVLAWLTGAGLQPLTVLPARFDGCQVSGDRLVCQTNVNDLWIMRLR